MKKVFITGISGTGKSALAKYLKNKGINTIDMDMENLCFWVNKENGEKVNYEAKLDRDFIDSHKWVCDLGLLKEMLNTKETTIMLGYPENIEDILSFFDKFFILRCKPETFLKRILERQDNNFGKEESAQRHLLETYKDFESKMQKIGAITLDTESSLESIATELLKQI